MAKEEKVKTSSVFLGFLVLKALRKKPDDRISIFEVTEHLKKLIGNISYRQLMFALLFLYQSGVIDFTGSYIYKK